MADTTSMFYGANPSIFEKARLLRNNLTKEEKKLWGELQKNQLLGLRFKSQHPISSFVADFYCHALKLVIEIDGENHNEQMQNDYDLGRTEELKKFGIHVIRFTNREVDGNIEQVLDKLKNKCHALLSELEKQ